MGALAGGAISPSECGNAGCPFAFNGGAFAEYEAVGPVGVRFEASFGRWNGDPHDPHFSGATFERIAGIVDGLLIAHQSPLRPYLLAGAGLAHVSGSASASGYNPFNGVTTRVDESQTVFAWRVGGGTRLPVGNNSTVVFELRYTGLPTSSKEVIKESLGFLELVAGVRF
ncbi:MAG: hypothetical protein ABI682_08500 [Acidobacteriota bacterium]